MDRRALLLGSLIAGMGCRPRSITKLTSRLSLLQKGDRWLYHRNNMLHASDVAVQVTDVQELGQDVRELTLRLSWQENIEKRVPNSSRRSGYSYEVVGQRSAWHLQKMRQSREGTLLWVGAGSTSTYTPESGNTQPDDPNTGIEPLFLGLEAGLFSGDREARTFPITPTHAGVESIQLTYKVVGVEPVDTKLGTMEALHLSGMQTQEMRGGKTWKIPFEDWYDGQHLLLKRSFKTDTGQELLGMKIRFGGTWTLKAFQPAATK